MILEEKSNGVRENYHIQQKKDVVVVGGGLSGVCAAIAAARSGVSVVLIQDRPVLGGNASSEIRMWILGATSHMGNNNRWSREGGVIDEILVENMHRNKEGNPVIFDTVLLEKILQETNITLLLNTAVFETTKNGDDKIKSIRAFNSQTSTEYTIHGNSFIDASGDGILGFLSGAPFRMGAETKEEFNELFAPDESYGKMLGHTIYFYSKDAGKPVEFIAPSFALKDIKKIPRYRNIKSNMQGCQFWWFEYGGREKDTIKETENIKWELWKVVYGVWDYIKNSGNFPEAENLTLDWVGTIPGKRESRRFIGDYMIKQQDIVNQNKFEDAVAFGGWAIDLHPGDGLYSKLPGCNQYHAKGVYDIPYRAMISKGIDNLFFAGRIISATHVAFGSTRVMATGAHAAQAVGQAAAICVKNNINAKDILEKERLLSFQNQLNFNGQSIIGKPIDYKNLSIEKPEIKASSTFELSEIPFNGKLCLLAEGFAQLLPLKAKVSYTFKFLVKTHIDNTITVQLRKSSKLENYTPDCIIESKEILLNTDASDDYDVTKGEINSNGEQYITVTFKNTLATDQYAFFTILPNEHTAVRMSEERLTGTVSLFQKINKAVSNNGVQEPPKDSGFDSFEFWTPKRRPDGENLALNITPAVSMFSENYIGNGYVRPYIKTNAWAASLEDKEPTLFLNWKTPQKINKIKLFFDTDFDHPMENVLMGHPEAVMPFCIGNYTIYDENDQVLFRKTGNYQSINDISLNIDKEISSLKVKFEHPSENVPATVFEIVCYYEDQNI